MSKHLLKNIDFIISTGLLLIGGNSYSTSSNYLPDLGKNYLRYEYDLISNKVIAVHYNEKSLDEFHHYYTYDADQRILTAQTAWGPVAPVTTKQSPLPGIGWDKDATYNYYKHGPLKRVELGEDQVQGMDYVYTLQGWLKGMNHPALDPNLDPGNDNNTLFSSDAFGMVLGYHANDFNRTSSPYNPITSSLISSQTGISNLFNGNISSWTLQTEPVTGVPAPGHMGFKYRYDQLNRIKTEDYNLYASNLWSNPTDYDNTYTYNPNGSILTLTRNGPATANVDRDNLTAHYIAGTNQLQYVEDAVPNGNYTIDIDNQNQGNYQYSAVGERLKDTEGGIDNIGWTVYKKIKFIKKTNGDSIIFTYDANNRRIKKRVKQISSPAIETYYIKDASGNTMSIYEKNTVGNSIQYKQTEVPIYGSDRLGVYRSNKVARKDELLGSGCVSCPLFKKIINLTPGLYSRSINKKEYELKDHLGNVRVTVSDQKNNDQTVNILSYHNFYAGGMPQPGRTFNINSYRFGYNAGSEKDEEITGEQARFFTTLYREGDTYTQTWWSPDTKEAEQPWQSPYTYMDRNPIKNNDPDGDVVPIFGALLGATIEIATQITVNSITGKDLFDLDYADIGVEAAIGAASGGLGNLAKLGKTGIRVTNAINTANKVIEGNKVLKVAVKNSDNLIKSSIDINDKGAKVVGVNKDIKEAGIEAGFEKLGKAGSKLGADFINAGAKKTLSKTETQVKRFITGSEKQQQAIKNLGELKQTIKGNEKAAAAISDVGSNTSSEKTKQKLK